MASEPAFSIGTLVTNPGLYEAMKQSFRDKGFGDDCEFIAIDNTGREQTDAYTGLNRLLNHARAPIIILCHQDVVLTGDGRTELEARLRDLQSRDPFWALAGNAGGSRFSKLHIRITDKFGENQNVNGPFPARVHSLDENFIVAKAEARVALSRDLSGFHMYGADLCTVADILGWTCYVIDFHLLHLGEGRTGEPFRISVEQFREKWNRALRDRYLQTTCIRVLVSGRGQSRWMQHLRFKLRERFMRIRRSIEKRRSR